MRNNTKYLFQRSASNHSSKGGSPEATKKKDKIQDGWKTRPKIVVPVWLVLFISQQFIYIYYYNIQNININITIINF